MTIEENLALAYQRTAKGERLQPDLPTKDKEFFREKLSLLGMGLGGPDAAARRALKRRPETGADPSDGYPGAAGAASAGMNIRPLWIRPRRRRCWRLTRAVIDENKITCLMVTHNMHQALELGNRTLMMADGSVVLDVAGEERAGMTVEDLLERFRAGAGRELDNDRILLSE